MKKMMLLGLIFLCFSCSHNVSIYSRGETLEKKSLSFTPSYSYLAQEESIKESCAYELQKAGYAIKAEGDPSSDYQIYLNNNFEDSLQLSRDRRFYGGSTETIFSMWAGGDSSYREKHADIINENDIAFFTISSKEKAIRNIEVILTQRSSSGFLSQKDKVIICQALVKGLEKNLKEETFLK